jgi:hypothetical protein
MITFDSWLRGRMSCYAVTARPVREPDSDYDDYLARISREQHQAQHARNAGGIHKPDDCFCGMS